METQTAPPAVVEAQAVVKMRRDALPLQQAPWQKPMRKDAFQVFRLREVVQRAYAPFRQKPFHATRPFCAETAMPPF